MALSKTAHPDDGQVRDFGKIKSTLLMFMWIFSMLMLIFGMERIAQEFEITANPTTFEAILIDGERVSVQMQLGRQGPEGQDLRDSDSGRWISQSQIGRVDPTTINEPLTWRSLLALLVVLSIPSTGLYLVVRWVKNENAAAQSALPDKNDQT